MKYYVDLGMDTYKRPNRVFYVQKKLSEQRKWVYFRQIKVFKCDMQTEDSNVADDEKMVWEKQFLEHPHFRLLDVR